MLQLIRFLFTNIVGVSLVATVGVLTCCLGNCIGFQNLLWPEKAVEMKMSQLEAKEEPGSRFLVLEGVHAFMDELRTLTLTSKSRRGRTTETKYHFIPLLSKATHEKWSKVRRGQEKYPYEECRVIVKVESAQLGSIPKEGGTLKGSTTVFSKGDKDVVEEFKKHAGAGYNPDRILLLNPGAEPLTAGGGIALGVCSMFIGVLCLVPLALVAGKKFRNKGAAPAPEPAPTSGGLDAAVRAGVEEGFRRAVAEAARQPAPAPAPVRPVEPVRPAPAPAPARPAPVPAPAPVQPAAPGIAANVPFHYLKGGQPQGPVPYAALQSMAASGQLSPDDMVWQAGTPNWVPARTVAGLFRR